MGLWLASYALIAQNTKVYFSEDPCLTPDGETVIFSYAGDLWRVPAMGGMASQLTAMDGTETRPRVSPDGKWVAFTASQYGNDDVYLMPLAGGVVTQLTFHQAGDQVASWAWDSQTIYFTSDRYNRLGTYTIGIKGGTPVTLFDHYFNYTHNAVEHPTSGELFFNETWESSSFIHRKRYKGAFNPDIKSYNRKTETLKQYTTYEGKDFWSIIDQQGQIYFLSDEYNGEYNLYSLQNGTPKRLTDFKTSVFEPQVSADGRRIVFRRDYQLWIYDVKTGKSQAVAVVLPQNNTLAKTQDFKVDGKITAFDVADDGKKMAFVSRGELFVSDMKGKFIRQLPTRADGRVLEVYWLKDNKSLIFNQTVKGYQNWFTMPADGSGKEKQLTSDQRNNRQMAFNSDKTKAVYISGRDELRLMELENYTSSLLHKDEYWGFYNDTPQFGPDDRHIVFSVYRNFERDILVYDLEKKQAHNLTQTGVTESAPFWSPDGKYIYLTSDRTQPAYPSGLQDPKLYRMALQAIDAPYRSDKFDELFKEDSTSLKATPNEEKDSTTKEATSKKKDKKKDSTTDKASSDEETSSDKEKPEVKIDFDGLMDRLEHIGPRYGNQGGAYVIQKEEKTTVLYISDHGEGKSSIWKTTLEPFEKPKTEQIKDAETSSLNIEEADGKYYLLFGGNLYTLKVDENKTEKIDISYTFRRQLKEEFEQMFYETWANLEENFYNETFHGLDWPVMRDRYAAYLPYINTRADLRRLLNDLLGELNTSHFGFYSSGDEEKIFYGTQSLATGILFENEDPYRVKHIVTESPASLSKEKILPGDRLQKVNGVMVEDGKNREFYFNQPSMDEELTLTFVRGDTTVDVKLHPTSYSRIRDLIYDEWVDENQQRVDTKTDKRIAYVHMKNMGGGELQNFLQEMVSEGYQREGLILDLRYNTGGNVHDAVLRFLSQRPYLNWKYREGQLAPQSNFGPAEKPLVLLINEQSLSDAEMTAQGFKELGLGTIIGTETYRWIIFTSGKGLVDGSFYRLPSWGCYTLDGKNLEKTGVAPDISVKNTFKDRIEDKDPQLDRAIEEVMKKLK